MEKKKLIAASLGGVVLIGAGAYMYLQFGQEINLPNLGTLIETGQALSDGQETGDIETDERVESGVIEGEEIVELSESELHEIFEEVYLESVYELRNYLEISKSQLLNSEYDRIELACPMGKTLPTDYKDQYNVWREEYRLDELSIIFQDTFQEMYLADTAYTHADIYGDSKVSAMLRGTAITVTGIGFDKADGWLRLENDMGIYYIEANKVSEQADTQTQSYFDRSESGLMYIIKNTSKYKTPSTDASKDGSLSAGEMVWISGVGRGDLAGWSEITIGSDTFYVRSECLSESKASSGSTNTNTNTGGQSNTGGQQSNTGGQDNTGGQQSNNNQNNNNTSSGGQQNNSGGSQSSNDPDAYWLTMYGYTAEQLRNLSDSELIALGFTQCSDGTWIDKFYTMIPIGELSEEDHRRAEESSKGVNWGG